MDLNSQRRHWHHSKPTTFYSLDHVNQGDMQVLNVPWTCCAFRSTSDLRRYFLCSHSSLLQYVCTLMAQLVFIFSFFLHILETLDLANYLVWFRFSPTTFDRRGRKLIWKLQLEPTMPMAGIEPGPPAQHAIALYIKPLPPEKDLSRSLYSK